MLNATLTDCSIQSICDYLANPTGQVNIVENHSGCNNPTEIAVGCGITLSCLPYGNYFVRTQEEVDSFFINYPNCYDLEGFLSIKGDGITELQGLNNLSSVEEHLLFYHCNSLSDFSGLNNLDSIGEMFTVGYWEGNGNKSLINFNGLDNLRYVGESLYVYFNDSLIDFSGLNNLNYVGHVSIIGNESLVNFNGIDNLDSISNGLSLRVNNSLTDLSGFENLTYIGNYIDIGYNDGLVSLSGINNVEASSIEYLGIYDNPQLSTCEVEVICEYLTDSASFTDIHDNEPGCNSRQEIEEACGIVTITESFQQEVISVFPNPASSEITISGVEGIIDEVSIYNKLGQRVISAQNPGNKMGVSWLPQGLYIVEVVWDEYRVRMKLIVQ